MSEQLLTPMEVAAKLKISRTTFYELRPQLIARGLRTLRVGKVVKYLESSLDRIICRAADSGLPLA